MSHIETELKRLDEDIASMFALRRELLREAGKRGVPHTKHVCAHFRQPDDDASFPMPISVTSVSFGAMVATMADPPVLVRVRRVGKDEPTHLGIYIGELPQGARIEHTPMTGALSITQSDPLPCIVVPSIGLVLTGAECWWQKIEHGDALEDITDLEVANAWLRLFSEAVR